MFSYPSPLISVLSLVYVGLFICHHLRDRDWPKIGLLATASVNLACCTVRLSLHPSTLAVWAAVAWAILTLFSLRRWLRSRLTVRPSPSKREDTAPKSPAARLHEIASEMEKLDAEKRELEQRPDANRL